MKYELTTFKASEKAISQDILDAVDVLVNAENEDAALTLVFDVNEEAKELRAFRQAAKEKGKTVRIRHRDETAVTKIGTKENGKAVYQGEVTLVVSLTEKYADGRGRKPKGETETAPKAEKATK